MWTAVNGLHVILDFGGLSPSFPAPQAGQRIGRTPPRRATDRRRVASAARAASSVERPSAPPPPPPPSEPPPPPPAPLDGVLVTVTWNVVAPSTVAPPPGFDRVTVNVSLSSFWASVANG